MKVVLRFKARFPRFHRTNNEFGSPLGRSKVSHGLQDLFHGRLARVRGG